MFPVWNTIELEGGVKIDLVNVSVLELGFKGGAEYQKICSKAQEELGLHLCDDPEIGSKLRRQYENQPEGEWLRLAMKPIPVPGSIGSQTLALANRYNKLWLCSDSGRPEDYSQEGRRFIFVQ